MTVSLCQAGRFVSNIGWENALVLRSEGKLPYFQNAFFSSLKPTLFPTEPSGFSPPFVQPHRMLLAWNLANLGQVPPFFQADQGRLVLEPMTLQTFPDEALLVLVARRDQAALSELYDRYASAVLGLARRMGFDIAAQEDCVQEVFMRIWNRAASFDPGKASGRSWVLAVAHHYCVDRVRQESSRPKSLDPIDDDESKEAFDLPGPGLDEEATLNRIRLSKALKVLSPDERAVIEMLHYQGHTYPDAAEQLGIPLGTLKARARRAMEKLRGALHEA